jgi:hypothetical protein
MSIKQNFISTAELDYPIVPPTLDIDFANTKVLSPRITFIRSSGGSYINSDGILRYAGVNEPRFDHDPITRESLGLLIEEGRANLILDPNSNYGYSMEGNIRSLEDDISPDGNIVPCKYNLIGATKPFLNVRVPAISVGTYTISVWLRSDEEYTASLAFIAEPFIEAYSTTITINRLWKRHFLTFTAINNTPAARIQLFFSGEGEDKKVSIWGVQLESGDFATSYIPRNPNQQSVRSADNVRIVGRNFSQFYNQVEGSIFVNYRLPKIVSPSKVSTIWEIIENANNRFLSFVHQSNDNKIKSSGFMNGGSIWNIDSDSLIFSSGDQVRTVFTYNNTDLALFSNGSSPVISKTIKMIPNVNTFFIGSSFDTSNYINSHISRLTYFPRKIANSQSQLLTC